MANEVARKRTEGQEASIAPAGFKGMTPAVAREVATIQGQIMLAKMYPRQMDDVWKKVEAACSRLKLAEAAIYRYARGGSDVTGPSIRLAEALINAYGNAKSGFEVIESSANVSRVRAYAYDMETNTIQERTFDVEHVRYTRKDGKMPLFDPRDIYETVANQAARRERACILALIPGDLQEYAVNLCRKTLEANVDISPQSIGNLLKAFMPLGVSKPMIEARIQRSLDAITADQYIDLRTVYASIKDGIAKVEDFFTRPEDVPSDRKEAAKGKSKGAAGLEAILQKGEEAEAAEAGMDGGPVEVSEDPGYDEPVGGELFGMGPDGMGELDRIWTDAQGR